MQIVKKRNKSYSLIYHYSLLLLLVIALAVSQRNSLPFFSPKEIIEPTKEDIKKLFNESDDFYKIDKGVYRVLADEERLGLVLNSDEMGIEVQGYGGKVPILLAINNDNQIFGLLPLDNKESKDYFQYITDSPFLDSWNKLSTEQAFKHDIDIVSGATITSEAIILGVRKIIVSYQNAEWEEKLIISYWQLFKDALFIIAIILSLAMAYVKSTRKYRIPYLIFIIVVLGIWLNKMLSAELINNFIVNGAIWHSNWQSILLIIIAIILPLLKKPLYYCNYICPFGAAQEVIGYVSPFKKKNLNKYSHKKIYLKDVYITLIWSSIVLGFYPNLAYLEPFLFFSFNIAGWVFVIFGCLILVASFFYTKPWCTLCPTGCALRMIKRRNK